MKKYEVKLGLGRMASNHTRTITVEAETKQIAAEVARYNYRRDVAEEIGAEDPIWCKILTVESVEEV